MRVVLVMFKDGEKREFPLNSEQSTVGRRRDCTLRIPTKDVSRQHATLLIDDNELIVRDLGSSNGTFVNDKRVAETELEAGDRLRIGPVTFVVQIDGEPAEIQPTDAESPGSIGEPSLDEGEAETFDLSESDFELDEVTELEEGSDDDEDEDKR